MTILEPVRQDVVQPEDVTSPRDRCQLIKVLAKNIANAGQGRRTCSIALLKWDGEARIGIRYDGRQETPLGSPNSNGHATWFIMPYALQQLLMPAIPMEDWAMVMEAFSEQR